MNNSILQCHPHLQTIQFSCPVDLIDSTFLLVNCLQPTKIHSFYNYSLWVMKRLHALNSKLVIACNYLEVSNSDVWGMQCFCSVVSRIFRKQHCKNTESPKNLNYQPLLAMHYSNMPTILSIMPFYLDTLYLYEIEFLIRNISFF